MTARLSLLLALVVAGLLVGPAPDASAQTATPTPVVQATPLERGPVIVVTARGQCLLVPGSITATNYESEGCSAPGAQPGDLCLTQRVDATTTNDADSLRVSAAYIATPGQMRLLIHNTTASTINAGVAIRLEFVCIR